MFTRTGSIASIVLLVFASAFAQVPALDPCGSQLPASLREILPKKFPGYRLAQVSDYLKEDVDQHKKDHKGNPCPGVASADVNGDGFTDFAFILSDKERRTILVVGRNISGKTWEVSKIFDFGSEGPGRSYVDKLKPGSYRDLFDTDRGPSEYTPEPGRVRRQKARNPGFIAGTIESSGVAFFFTGKQWVHLWLSD